MDARGQLELIKRGAVETISEGELLEKLSRSLKAGEPLKVKAGFDPSAPDIHLGHTVLLRKLKHFQELGHKVIFLIGDATALIGDPSGQSQTRKTLTWEEIEKNVQTYVKQVGKILDTKDRNLFECRYNSDWFSRHGHVEKETPPFPFEKFVELAQRYTVARLLERDDFQKRLEENKPISFLELFYPLMQGYDSVMLKSDVEIGGTDQKFNMLVARNLQGAYGQQPQAVITLPLLEGTDGVQKMSKSLGNHIGINEEPKQMFGKIMSISDEMMFKYYGLLTDADLSKVKDMHPMEAKKNLAGEIVRQYHGKIKAKEAQGDFEQKFQKRDPFDTIKTQDFAINTAEALLLKNVLCDPQAYNLFGLDPEESTSKFRQKIKQGAVTVNGKKVTDINYKLEPNKEQRIKVGKLKFIKLILRI